ncbi:MAG: AI-2E family transporter [Candidatus Paracaedibacteraceae bacterium]|nr:AI-2E family transporter [Candidatus Paracaedibacteraceae bacterium]
MQKSLSSCIAHPNFLRFFLLALLIVAISIGVLNSLGGILAPFVTGFIGAYLFDKLVRRLEVYLSRSVASFFLILTFVIILTFITSVILPYLQKELLVLVKSFPHFAELVMAKVQPLLTSAGENHLSLNSIKSQLSNYVGDIVKWSVQVIINLLTNGMLLANLLTLVILTPIVMFYLLRDWPILIITINNRLPTQMAVVIRRIFKRIDETLTAYLIGQSTVCLLLAVLYSVGLFCTGIEKFLPLGIMTGVLSFIPYLGMVIGLFASLSIAFSAFVSWGQIVGILVVYVVVSLIEGNVLTPRFVGGRIGLHPVWILFSLLAAGTWFGFAGILVAIPSAAIIGVLVREAIGEPNQAPQL